MAGSPDVTQFRYLCARICSSSLRLSQHLYWVCWRIFITAQIYLAGIILHFLVNAFRLAGAYLRPNTWTPFLFNDRLEV
jgi:uncharacterized membrane protein